MVDSLKKLIKKLLQYQARAVLRRYKPKVIAITGSVGKSLTREAIYTVLSKKFFVRKSEKSFTAELGVPLTIIGGSSGVGSIAQLLESIFSGFFLFLWKQHYPEYLILEIDGDKPGDLTLVGSWLPIDILVMTAIGEVPSHIELFSTKEKFLEEKRSLIDFVKRDGFIAYNMDDSVTSNLALASERKLVSCGIGAGPDVFSSTATILYGKNKNHSVPTGMSFHISRKEGSHELAVLGSLGTQNQYASLLACGVGMELGLTLHTTVQNLNKFKVLPGRMNILPGIKDTVIIDDSYNSSPIALRQAVSVFGDTQTSGRRIAVVGDMLELGKFSSDEHKKVAELLKDVADVVVCVGIRSRRTAEELLNLGFDESKILLFDEATEAGVYLQNFIEPGDLVLVKGSQAMRMERVVEEIMRHPEDKNNLLIRQEEDWQGR